MTTLRVGLLWHTLGHANLGVDALSRANIEILRAAARRARIDVRFVLLGMPGAAPTDADVEQGALISLKRMALGRLDFARAVRACDLVFDTSAGDSFADIYGPRRFVLQAVSKGLVRPGRLVLSPQTIGPFEKAWSRPVARGLLRRARLTFTRDALSTAAVKALDTRAAVEEASDVAFRLPFTRPARALGGPCRIGINVSGLLFSAGARFGLALDYPDLIRKSLAALVAQPDNEVWLVPHVLAPGVIDDDGAVSESLATEFPGVQLAPRFASSIAAKSFIAGLDVFSGARMHACIAAFSAGVPVIPVAYSRKFNGVFNTLGYGRIVDGKRDDTDTALAALLRMKDERAAAAAEIAPALAEAQRRLARYEDWATDLFQRMAS